MAIDKLNAADNLGKSQNSIAPTKSSSSPLKPIQIDNRSEILRLGNNRDREYIRKIIPIFNSGQ
jgi:hypothetical protein